MSENESFIDEVTEEVRRDKLYLFLRKYGWIIGLLIVLIIAVSIFIEIRSNARALEAQKLGDLLTEMLDRSESAGTSDLGSLSEGLKENSLPLLLLRSKLSEQTQDFDEAIRVYEDIFSNEKIPSSFRNLAKFKALLLVRNDPARAEEILNQLIAPGNTFRLLALEQKLLFHVKNSKWREAQEIIDLILNDPETSQALKSRIDQLQTAVIFGNSSNL